MHTLSRSPTVSRVLAQLIEHASDALASAVYQRVLDDRHAREGRVVLTGASMTWEHLVAWALDEQVLDETDAEELLLDAGAEGAAGKAVDPLPG